MKHAELVLGPERLAYLAAKDLVLDIENVYDWHCRLVYMIGGVGSPGHPQDTIDYIAELKELYPYMDRRASNLQLEAADVIISAFSSQADGMRNLVREMLVMA